MISDDLEARARRLLASPGNKRVELMVSGPLSRLGTVRQSLDQVGVAARFVQNRTLRQVSQRLNVAPMPLYGPRHAAPAPSRQCRKARVRAA
jgi:hypothetical protein